MKTILDDDGNEEIVFTQEEITAQLMEKEAAMKAEYEAKLADKDAHVKDKLYQFEQAKKSAEQLHAEAMAGVAEAKKLAEEAKMSVTQSKESELSVRKDYWVQSVAGGDADLKAKIEEAYNMLNLPAGTDKEISERVQKAVSLAGISHISTPNLSFGGSMAPNFQAAGEQSKEAAHEAWKKEYGISI